MSNYDWDEIETALAIAEERDLLSESGRSIRSPQQTTILQRYNDKIAARLLAEDRSDLDQILEEYQAEGRRFNEAKKDMAIERSSGRLAMLRSRIAASRKATEDIMSRRSETPDSNRALGHDRIVLDLASSIRLKGGEPGDAHTVIDMRDTALEPWANRASVSDRWPSEIDSFYEAGVGFPFVWTNPYPWSVVLDVESAVAVNGLCRVGADSTLFGTSVYVKVFTFLEPSLPFGDPVYPPSQVGQTVLAGEVSAESGFLGVGEIDSVNVAGYYGMSYHAFVVPGGQRAVFEAGSRFYTRSRGDCTAEANFSTGDFQVLCPVVDLTIVWP